MTPDNLLLIKLRLFDNKYEIAKEIGKYENVMSNDLNIEGLMREVKQAFSKTMKQLEIDLTNLKKGGL